MIDTVNHMFILTPFIFAITVMIHSYKNQLPEKILMTNLSVVNSYDKIVNSAKKRNHSSCSINWEFKEETLYVSSIAIRNDIIRLIDPRIIMKYI